MKIVCVHGIGQTYRGAASLSLHWKAALRDGVIEAGGADVSESDIAMVAYGALFRQNTRSVGARVDPESLDEAEQTLLQAYWQEAAALSAASDGTEPQESPAIQPPEFEGRARMPQLMQRALRQLSKSKYFKAIGGPSAALAFVRQVRLFLHDREFKADILERFAAQMSSQTRVLIGHSLGSVVAYEGLCAHPEGRCVHHARLSSWYFECSLRCPYAKTRQRPGPVARSAAVDQHSGRWRHCRPSEGAGAVVRTSRGSHRL